jgi:hypothetical protein
VDDLRPSRSSRRPTPTPRTNSLNPPAISGSSSSTARSAEARSPGELVIAFERLSSTEKSAVLGYLLNAGPSAPEPRKVRLLGAWLRRRTEPTMPLRLSAASSRNLPFRFAARASAHKELASLPKALQARLLAIIIVAADRMKRRLIQPVVQGLALFQFRADEYLLAVEVDAVARVVILARIEIVPGLPSRLSCS